MTTPLNHVLCVDDEEDILEIVKLCLADLKGINVTTDPDALNAISRLGVIKPDLILLDMMMPRINGMQAMEKFREVAGFKTIPVILMTARAQPHEVKEYLNQGATSVIIKPFDPMALGDQILAIWDSANASS